MYCDVNLPLWITYNYFTYVVALFFIFFILDKN